MSAELFPSSEMAVKSPRLKWLATHNLALGELPDGVKFCVGKYDVGFGDTHLEAELNCASIMKIAHYSVTEFKKAIAPVTALIDCGE